MISQVKSINNNIMSPIIFTNYVNGNLAGGAITPISSFQKEVLSIDLSESKYSEGDIQEIISYENNQISSIDGMSNIDNNIL